MTMTMTGTSKIQVRFLKFHDENPHVYQMLVNFCRRYRARNGSKCVAGIRMIWCKMRWELIFQTKREEDEPKLNDQFTSRYARLIMQQEPDLKNLFKLRPLRERGAALIDLIS